MDPGGLPPWPQCSYRRIVQQLQPAGAVRSNFDAIAASLNNITHVGCSQLCGAIA